MNKIFNLVKKGISLSVLSLFIFSCAAIEEQDIVMEKADVKEAPMILSPAEYKDFYGWYSDEVKDALKAFKISCDKMKTLPEGEFIKSEFIVIDYKYMENACNEIDQTMLGDSLLARGFFEKWFDPYMISTKTIENNKGKVTGYYEAGLRGSFKPTCDYLTPIYAKPTKDADRLYTREEIEKGALRGKAHVLFWVSDPVDAFILHIQGSGVITMDDGSTYRVGYAGNNGGKFKSISSIMKEAGIRPEAGYSMSGMRTWLQQNPEAAQYLMNKNPRYIFFTDIKGNAPVGAQGVPLTPKRSVAVDRKYIPLGVPLWLEAKDPDGIALNRLVVAQDVGSAIKGPIRADFFFGYGEKAFNKAARMNYAGNYFVFLPKNEKAFTVRQGDYLF